MAVHITCLGRLVADPVQRSSTSGKLVTSFSFVTNAIATDSNGKRKPLFLNVNAWGTQGDNIQKYCKKGTQLQVVGSIYDNTAYIKKTDGSPAASMNITLDHFEFTSPKRE